MPAINLQQPLSCPVDPLSALRVTPSKTDAASSFDRHLQRVAAPATRDSGPPTSDNQNRSSTPAEKDEPAKRTEARSDEKQQERPEENERMLKRPATRI